MSPITRLIRPLAGLLTAFAAMATLPVSAQTQQPGQYEYSVKATMMGMNLPAMTFKHCVTQSDIDQGQAYVNQQQQSGCTVSDRVQANGQISYTMSCKDPAMQGSAKGTYSDTSFDIETTTKMTEPMPMTGKTRITGKRIGGC